jgi:hypothetical protein
MSPTDIILILGAVVAVGVGGYNMLSPPSNSQYGGGKNKTKSKRSKKNVTKHKK